MISLNFQEHSLIFAESYSMLNRTRDLICELYTSITVSEFVALNERCSNAISNGPRFAFQRNSLYICSRKNVNFLEELENAS